MLIGYARVSTPAQSLEPQLKALVGCDRIFQDIATGGSNKRDGLATALEYVRTGDTLVVWKLDRLGRTVGGLIELAAILHRANVNLRSLTEGIDTSTAAGRFFFHMLAALAQMEREMLKERIRAGLDAARAIGRIGGRPKIMDAAKMAAATTLFTAGATLGEVSRALNVSKATILRNVPKPNRTGESQRSKG